MSILPHPSSPPPAPTAGASVTSDSSCGWRCCHRARPVAIRRRGARQRRFVLIDQFYVSKPSEVLQSLRQWQNEGVLLSSVWLTFQTTFIGFAIGS